MMEKKEDANPSGVVAFIFADALFARRLTSKNSAGWTTDLSKHSIDPPPVQVKKEVSVAGCFVTLKEGGELGRKNLTAIAIY
ncbi:hypothetical protein Plhal304r1_c012g0045581 [Plasmopara halstedii]